MATKKQSSSPIITPEKKTSPRRTTKKSELLVAETTETPKTDLTDLVNLDSVQADSVEKIAKEVLAGQWNNSEGRDARLLAAGHNPDLINKKINELRS